jgi:hypothetical protein
LELGRRGLRRVDFALTGLDVMFIEQRPEHVTAMREHRITVNLPTRTLNASGSVYLDSNVAAFRDMLETMTGHERSACRGLGQLCVIGQVRVDYSADGDRR